MAYSRNNHDSLMSDINVTPFVDVMLVLLIIFMVTAPMMVQGVNVSLPETENSDNIATEEDPLIVSIDQDNKILINDLKKRTRKYCRGLLENYKVPVHVKIVTGIEYSARFKKIR